jgi:hypothetical protein
MDRPVAVFQLGGVASPDSADARTFRVWVDGDERSRLFHIDGQQGNVQAWGALGDSTSQAASSPSAPLSVGVHLVTAQLCTVRGVCTTIHAAVTVLPATAIGNTMTAAAAPSAHGTAQASGAATPLAVIPPAPRHNLVQLFAVLLRRLWFL